MSSFQYKEADNGSDFAFTRETFLKTRETFLKTHNLEHHGSKCKEKSFVRRDAMLSRTNLPKCPKILLLPFSGLEEGMNTIRSNFDEFLPGYILCKLLNTYLKLVFLSYF
jgi:hypothetical protein